MKSFDDYNFEFEHFPIDVMNTVQGPLLLEWFNINPSMHK